VTLLYDKFDPADICRIRMRLEIVAILVRINVRSIVCDGTWLQTSNQIEKTSIVKAAQSIPLAINATAPLDFGEVEGEVPEELVLVEEAVP